MTFRKLLQCCDREKVYQWIGRPGGLTDEGASPDVLASLSHDYDPVIKTLLHLPASNRRYRFAVRRRDAPRDAEFISWFYNPDYVAPPPGKTPWATGDADGECCQKCLGLETVPWKHLIDAEVLHSKNLPAEVVVAAVLLQITILGFEEKTQEQIHTALKTFAQDAADAMIQWNPVQ